MGKVNLMKKVIYLILCFSLVFQQTGLAQMVVQLDIAGHIKTMNNTLTREQFRPSYLRYLGYDSINNDFKLLLDKGTELNTGKDIARDKEKQEGIFKNKTKELLDYFFIGISLPNESFWVNLRPDSPDNIIDGYLAQTDMGKILLEADMQLKKDTARMTSPETAEGKEYWDKLYKKAGELFGSENITIPTLTRPWIVPDEIIIRDSSDNAYIYKATLKVMLEQDYLKDSKDYSFTDERLKQLNEYSTRLIRENIIPNLTKEVNIGKNYASLRQVYHSLILAQWFKQKFYGKEGHYSRIIDRKNLQGLTSKGTWSKDTYFKEYRNNFQKGEYNLKEQVYTLQGKVIRSYMSGGIALEGIQKVTQNVIPADNGTSASPIREAMLGSNLYNIIASSYHEGNIEHIDFPFKQPQQKTTVSSPIKKPSILTLSASILSMLLSLSSCGGGMEYSQPPNPPVDTETITLENNQVVIVNGSVIYEIKTNNDVISINTTYADLKITYYHILNLKDKTIISNAKGKEVTLVPTGDTEEYNLYLSSMLSSLQFAIRTQQTKPVLTAEQLDFLNKISTILSNHQWFVPNFIDVTNGFAQYRIKSENGEINIKYSAPSVHSSSTGRTLDTQANTISYIPYPYSRDQEDKRVTLTFANNPKEYSDALGLMILEVKDVLQIQGANPPLTAKQIEFLNRVLTELYKQQMQGFQVYTSNFYREYKITADNGKITTAAADIQHRGVSYSLLELKNSGLTLDTKTGYISYYRPYPYDPRNQEDKRTLKLESNPEEYSDALELMINAVKGALEIQGANPPLTAKQIDFLNRVLALLNNQLTQNFQVYFFNGVSAYTIKDDNGKITIKSDVVDRYTGGSDGTLNTKDGSISWGQEDKRVTITFVNYPQAYSEILVLMIEAVKDVLQIQGAYPPLTYVQIDFLKRMLALLNDQVMKNFQVYNMEPHGLYIQMVRFDNGKITTEYFTESGYWNNFSLPRPVYTLDTKTKSISYIPYPYASYPGDHEDKRITLTFANNHREYSDTLGVMISDVKNLLTTLAIKETNPQAKRIYGFSVQIDFLNRVLAKLYKQQMQNFQDFKIQLAIPHGPYYGEIIDISKQASLVYISKTPGTPSNYGDPVFAFDLVTGAITAQSRHWPSVTYIPGTPEYQPVTLSLIALVDQAIALYADNDMQRTQLEWLKGTLEGYILPTGAQPGSSPIREGKDKKGGIDFRALPIMTKPILVNPGVNLNLNFTAPIPASELENERGKIKNMLGAGIIPSSERIADYLISSYQKKDGFNQEVDNVFYFIADILRIEEERVLPTEPAFRQILGMLEQIPA